MKMTKKMVFVVALAVCLIAVLSMSTLAWFNASDDVTNKFFVADSADTPDKIFSVEVTETDEDGNPTKDGKEYYNIAPGSVLAKDPTVKNTGAYDQWIRVRVTVTNADAWIAALGNGYDLGTMFGGHDETVWTRAFDEGGYNGTENTIEYVYYLNDKLVPDETVTLFETVTIPTQLDQEDMVFIGAKFEMTIVAEAIQADNNGTTAREGFAVYPTQP